MTQFISKIEAHPSEHTHPEQDGMIGEFREDPPIYSDDGVDLTLIRWMISLSPLSRLRTAQRYANSARRLQNASRRV